MVQISLVKKKSGYGNWIIYFNVETYEMSIWDDPTEEFEAGEDPIYCMDVETYPFLAGIPITTERNVPTRFRSVLELLLWLSQQNAIDESVLLNTKDTVKHLS